MAEFVSIVECDKSLRSLLGNYCWGAEWSAIGNLSLQFGTPRLEILRQPQKRGSQNKEVQRHGRRRLISVIGQWTLWIYVARWRLMQVDGPTVTGHSSFNRIFKGLQALNGQKLLDIHIEQNTGSTRLSFDLGIDLEVRRRDKQPESELLIIYGPDRFERAIRADGTFHRVKHRVK